MIVPGSGLVKEQAEAEGLDKIFKAAGFDWREPGCSMCLAMNPDKLAPGERCASTSNRNFEGRQGYKGRTHLVVARDGGRRRDRRPLRRRPRVALTEDARCFRSGRLCLLKSDEFRRSEEPEAERPDANRYAGIVWPVVTVGVAIG